MDRETDTGLPDKPSQAEGDVGDDDASAEDQGEVTRKD
jgi:hypothetical protein